MTIIPVIVIGIVIALIIRSRNSKMEREHRTALPKVEHKKLTASERVGTDFRSGGRKASMADAGDKKDLIKSKSIAGIVDTKETDRIYSYRADAGIWICPECETENTDRSKKCCVCYALRS